MCWLTSAVGQNIHENEERSSRLDFFYCQTTTESKRCRSRIHGPGSRNNGSTNRQAAATTGASQPDHVAPAARLAPRPPASTIPVDSRLLCLPPLLCPAPAFPSPHLARRSPERAEQAGGPVGSAAAAAKMNDADVSKQIQQMVRFIRQEAEEKASEISVSAEEVSFLSLRFTLLPRSF